MTDDDLNFLANYKPNTLYTHPAKSRKGAYATLVGDSEQLVAEIDVTPRCKLAISAFYVQNKTNFDILKIRKLQYHKTYGWREDGHIQVNHFQVEQMREFISIISSLELGDAKKTRISLDNIHIGALGALLSSTQGAALIRELAASPELHHDIYAVATKREALVEFQYNLKAELRVRTH